ncbi:MAG TPA: peptidoglycan DD-metalloendopeptidase family protein [Thermoanaerobaculia bacterium]|nr:peptidoglycan DD-metalloendopeptidase family protein [Thermoanaerobaculia bacterium]
MTHPVLRRGWLCPGAGVLLLLLRGGVAGQMQAQTQAPAQTERQSETDLARIRARIATLRERLKESTRSVATLSEEIRRLDWKLEIAQQEARLLAARRAELTLALAATRAERQAASAAAGRSANALFARARLLQRFGRYGYLRVLLEARDAPGFLRGVERLDDLARRDGRLLAAHRVAQRRLESDLAREEGLKSELDQNWTRARRELFAMSRLRGDRDALLSRERRSAVTGQEEVHALSDKADRLERLLKTLATQSSGETADASAGIRPWKGVLDWPARGAVLETFGRHRHPKFDAWTVSNGIAVAVPAGSPVRAVYAGKTAYAQWLAEYGNLVILDHGDGVFTLYAWLQSVAVLPGARVAAGEPVGTSGTGPGRNEPGVYFEIRDRQKASDPVAWLR